MYMYMFECSYILSQLSRSTWMVRQESNSHINGPIFLLGFWQVMSSIRTQRTKTIANQSQKMDYFISYYNYVTCLVQLIVAIVTWTVPV